MKFTKQDGSNFSIPDKLKMMDITECIKDIDHYMPPSVNEGIPYVMTSDFIGERNEIDFTNCKKIGQNDYLQLSKKIAPRKGDVIFARYATIGTVKYVEEDRPFVVSYSCVTIRSKKNVLDSKYLLYYFKSPYFEKQITKQINTGTQKNIGIDSLQKHTMFVPMIEEQHFIAECLSSVDEVIADFEGKVEHMQNQKKGVMQKLFSQEVRFKNENGKGFPDWKVSILGIEANIYQPKTITSSDISEDGKFNVFGANGYIGKYEKYNHDTDQIAVCCRGASCGTINYIVAPVWITGNSMVCNIDENNMINKQFFFYCLSQMDLRIIITGGAQPQITRGKLEKVKINIPCLEEQQKIADCLTAYDDTIEDLQKTVEHWKNVKKGLLQQLFDWEGIYS